MCTVCVFKYVCQHAWCVCVCACLCVGVCVCAHVCVHVCACLFRMKHQTFSKPVIADKIFHCSISEFVIKNNCIAIPLAQFSTLEAVGCGTQKDCHWIQICNLLLIIDHWLINQCNLYSVHVCVYGRAAY